MSDPLVDILQALVDVVGAVTPPSGQRPITAIVDPDTIGPFPFAFPEEAGISVMGSAEAGFGMSFGYAAAYPRYRIDLHLLFAPQDTSYQMALKREWTSLVLTALMANDRLSETADEMSFGDISFRPLNVNGTSYLTTTFPLFITTAA